MLFLLGLMLALPSQAQDFSRSMAPVTDVQPFYVLGAGQERWQGGQINWYYNPAHQPPALSTDDVVALFISASAKWEGMCNLKFNYMGITDKVPNMTGTWDTVDRTNVFGWDLLTGAMAAYAGYTRWWYGADGYMVDVDMMLNTAQTWNQSNKPGLEGLITHELGHALGLNHSNVSISIMFANPYHTAEYQRTLRGDDAAGCGVLYGVSANADSNRVFNWAEQAYVQYLAPAVQPSAVYQGYYYRHYPGTNSYVGTKDGNVYYLAAGGQIVEVGPLADFTGPAFAAGY